MHLYLYADPGVGSEGPSQNKTSALSFVKIVGHLSNFLNFETLAVSRHHTENTRIQGLILKIIFHAYGP